MANPFGGRLVFWGETGAFSSVVLSNTIVCCLQKIFNNITQNTLDTVFTVSLIVGGMIGVIAAIIYSYHYNNLKKAALNSEYSKVRLRRNTIIEILVVIGINLLALGIFVIAIKNLGDVKFL